MKVLTCITPGDLQYGEQEKPILTPDHAIIKIKRIGICGTDLHAFEGTQPYFSYPRILGHELSGELVEFDNAPGFTVGERVTFIPYFNCGHCIACQMKHPNACVNIKVCGVHVDGGMVDYLSVPSASLIHGNGLSYDELALIEPLAIGAHGVSRAGIQKDEFVLIIGAGPIGLGTMEFARIAGAKVIAMDVNAQRLQFCKDKLAIPHVVNAMDANVLEQIQEITSGNMATVVIDATGNLKAINQGLYYLAHGGRYVLIGLQKGDLQFNHPEFHKRETTLMSSRNALREDFDQVIEAMKQQRVQPENYITHRVNFEHLKDEMANLLNPISGVIKAMVTIA